MFERVFGHFVNNRRYMTRAELRSQLGTYYPVSLPVSTTLKTKKDSRDTCNLGQLSLLPLPESCSGFYRDKPICVLGSQSCHETLM